jgi:hypothetical protein
MLARIEVELDIFSGRANPTWVLGAADADALVRRVAALPRIPPCELSTKLGYRGLIVKFTRGADARLIRVQSRCVEIVEGGTTHARDEGRELERWLIETGRPHMEHEVMELVEREVR